MKLSKTKALALTVCILTLSLAMLTGCGSSNNSAQSSSAESSQASAAVEEPSDYTIDSYPLNLMDELANAKTVEEANAIIGSEGEYVDATENKGSAVTVTNTTYKWDLGNDVTIEGEFTTNDGEADSYRDSEYTTYTIDFPSNRLKDFADFSKWSDIKAQHEAGTLNYDGLVELVGTPGIKKVVSTKGNWTYYWYDEDGGYLNVGSGPAGNLGLALSGRF